MYGGCRGAFRPATGRRGARVQRELNVLALFKGSERFIFVYDDDSRDALVDDIRHKAADPAVALTWFDAAVLTDRVRNPAAAAAELAPHPDLD